jgi:general nucleoside transport system ATP-binding protein
VVIVSSELDEIYALADRIAVMYEGKITGFRPPTVSADELGMLMAGAGQEDAAPVPAGGPDPSAPDGPDSPAADRPDRSASDGQS